MTEHIKPGAVVMIPTAYSGKERAAWMDGFAKARELFDKSSFQHWGDEQEGNGPDAPSVGGKEGDAKDAARLDFMTAPDMPRYVEAAKGLFRVYEDKAPPEAPDDMWRSMTPSHYPTAREAIDAAMSALSASQEGAEG